jgi:amidase
MILKVLLMACSCMITMATYASEVPIIEIGIEDIRAALLEDGVSCSDIIQSHLDRIEKYDGILHSVIAVNTDAQRSAKAIDTLTRDEQRKLPLLCTPVLIKDNIDVAGMATTAGSRLLANNVALNDASAVAAIRRAGGIVLAKTNMSEFAFNYKGASAIGGRTRNPYDVRLSAGGSSSGNAAALAASFAVVALGTDTSGSVRVPSAVTGLVGLRPTFGAVDTRGVVPLSRTQDVVGPMCRTADDCLRLMTVIAEKRSGPEALAHEDLTLADVRVGVVRDLFPADRRSATFMKTVDDLIDQMRRAGVTVQDVAVEDVQVIAGNKAPSGERSTFASRSVFDFPAEFSAYLRARNAKEARYTLVVDELRYLNQLGLEGDRVVEDAVTFGRNYENRQTDDRYRINGAYRDNFVKARLNKAFSGDDHQDKRLEFLMYPSVHGFNDTATKGPNTGGTHRLSAYSGYPAVAFPAGWARPSEWEAFQPVGIELLGQSNDDVKLLRFVQLLQRQLAPRHVPTLQDR